MSFRDEVRGYFEREARRMPAPADLRADVSARAAEAPSVRPAQARWAALVAALLAIAIIAGLMAVSGLRHAVNPPIPGGKSGQHGELLDADLIDLNNGWALLAACQEKKPLQADSALTQRCWFWAETTNDGGRTWANPVQVGASYQGFPDSAWADTFRHIHFANRLDGFVYGLGYLFATHDGGRTWDQLNFGSGELLSITGSQEIYAVMDSHFLISTDYGRSWIPYQLPTSFRPTGGVSFSLGELLLSSAGAGDMLYVIDGAVGRLLRGNCASDSLANSVATSDGNEICSTAVARRP